MTDVLISGAGIAGTALAAWLTRYGHRATVVERAPAPRDGGYKVDIRGAALEVVDRLGVLDDIRALRTDVRGGSIVTADGRRVASMGGDTFGGRQCRDAEILRGDLGRILYGRTAGSVEYRFEDSIAALREEPGGIAVSFARGDTRAFDLVVGADGVHSATRALAFGPHQRYVRDLGYRIAIFTVPNHLGLDRWELTYVEPGRTALTYATAHTADVRAMFLFRADAGGRSGGNASGPDGSGADGPGFPSDRAGQQRLLAEAYAGSGWEVPRLLAAMPGAPDFYFDSISQVHLDRWSAGRVTLLGDAAHCASPASGQGTSLALVGAYLLATELTAAGTDLAGGLRGYERRMRPFAERNQKLGPANIRRMVLRDRRQVRMALATLSLLHRMPGGQRLMARAIAPIEKAATAIDLGSASHA